MRENMAKLRELSAEFEQTHRLEIEHIRMSYTGSKKYTFFHAGTIIYMYILVMERFGNLEVGLVFGFLHPETAVSI